jgi:hypothetical protein
MDHDSQVRRRGDAVFGQGSSDVLDYLVGFEERFQYSLTFGILGP